MRRIALPAIALALVAASAAAFAFTETLKLERLPVVGPRVPKSFSPVCECPTAVARFELRFRVSDDVEAAILDADGEVVRELGERRVQAGLVGFEWDGRDDAGEVVPDARYRLRVQLAQKRRTIVVPNPVRVDTRPPEVELVRVRPLVFSPDGDGRGDFVRLRYVADEGSAPILLAEGEVVLERRLGRPKSRVEWDGTVDGDALPPGSYRLSVRVRDAAGNLSDPTEETAVVIRYVEVVGGPFRVRQGGTLSFGVDTDAAQHAWRLRRAAGGQPGRVVLSGRGGGERTSVRLPARLRRGAYRLEVDVGDWRDTATVLVTRRTP